MGGKAKEDPDSSQRRGRKERGRRKLCVSLLDLWIDRWKDGRESRIVNRLNYYRDFGSFGGGECSRGPKRARLER